MSQKYLFWESDDSALYCYGGHPHIYPQVGKNRFRVFSKISGKSIIFDWGMPVSESLALEGDGKITNDDEEIYGEIESIWDGVEAVVPSHIHLDHVGDIPWLYKEMQKRQKRRRGSRIHVPPIISSPYTTQFVMSLFEGSRFSIPHFYGLYDEEGLMNVGQFEVYMRQSPHNVPQNRYFVARLPRRRITSGYDTLCLLLDYKKADCLQTQGLTQLFEQSLALWRDQVDVMVIDTLYCDREGFSPSEDETIPAIEKMLAMAPSSLIVSCISSSTFREENIFKAALGKYQFLVQGRTMRKHVALAQSAGWLQEENGHSDETLLYDRFLMLATGCYGPENSVLERLSRGDGRPFRVLPDFSFGLLCNPIPGSMPTVRLMVANLLEQVPKGYVFVSDLMDDQLGITAPNLIAIPKLAVSGHGFRGDHDWALDKVRPKFIIPFHYPSEKQKFIDKYYQF